MMYSDKDSKGKISIMDLSFDEARDLAAILFEFERLSEAYSRLPERERLRLAELSETIRHLIINELK